MKLMLPMTPVMVGITPSTMIVASPLVALAVALVRLQRNFIPSSATVSVGVVYVACVAPLMFAKLVLPAAAFCH